ncbi:acyl-CoA-6-aminopenicillanic acid acyltransferase [Mesorhizobium sp. M1E.F.Ca.ET.045.02.1.1]|nr:acyl-CoA-6-aminopenicillanic acid acyltransferase [Mesorhizobium sp. M1E.F.Ca.ET.045.02.1.1]
MTPVSPIPVVVLSGSPYERGFQHGNRFAGAIGQSLGARLASLSTAEMSEVFQRASTVLATIDMMAPEVGAEIRGIADGVGRDVLDIVLRSSFELLTPSALTGCSGLAVQTSDGALIAQNWDGPPGSDAEQALFIHVSAGGFEFATVASAGGLGWVGLNRAGFGLVNNDLILTSRSDGIPSQIVRRVFLGCQDVDAAIERAKSLPHMAGRAYLFGDASNQIASVEVSARHGVSVCRSASFFAHTNHALDAQIRDDEDAELLARQYPSSQKRLEILKARGAHCTNADEVMVTLRDQTDAPDAVCKQTSVREPTQTAFSVAMQCWDRTLFLARGMPSVAEYQRISL